MSKKKQNLVIDIGVSIAITVLSLYMFIEAGGFSTEARLFPQLIAIITMTSSAVVIAKSMINLKKENLALANQPDAKKPAAKVRPDHMIMLAIGVAYVLLLRYVGFIICTMVVLIGIPYLLGFKNHKVIWIVGVLLTLFCYYIFRVVFYIPLPQGIITFI